MNPVNRPIERFTLQVALGLSLLITVLVPASYVLFSYRYLQVVLDVQSEMRADAVSGIIRSNPAKWRFEEVRFSEILERAIGDNAVEARRLFDTAGETVASNHVTVSAPRIVRIHNIYDAGSIVGSIEVTRSLQPMLQLATLLAIVSLAVAVAVFLLFRTIPAKTIQLAYRCLEESERKYRSLYESMQEGMALHQSTFDSGGFFTALHIVDVNPACVAMFGGDAGAFIGGDSLTLFGDLFCSKISELLQVLDHKSAVSFELTLPVTDKIIAVRAFSPGQGLIATFFEDITYRKEHEKEQLKIEKLESLGVLAGGIAHDFNNILSGIMGNISFAQIFLDADHKSHKLLVEAEKASVRATELAQQLLTFARGGEPVKKVVSIRQVVNDAVTLMLHGSNVLGDVEIPDSIHAIEADEGQMSQVFHNIIINATQAMPGGGTLRISAHNEMLEDNNLMSLPPGLYIRLTLADQGCGIPDDDLKRIFDPYFTTKLAGNGLGLASVYSIVKRHGGHIGASAETGKGTTFTIHLPSIGETYSTHQTVTASKALGVHCGGSILLMDDEQMIRDMTTQMLEYLGYRASSCGNGAEAIAQYKAAREAGTPYSAVIMDLTIPGGMGGREAAEQIIAIDPQACLIVSSGYSNDPVMSDHGRYGFAGAAAKPYKLKELGLLLSSVLSVRQVRI